MIAEYRQARDLIEKYRDKFPEELAGDMEFPNEIVERWREHYTQTLPILHKHSADRIALISNRIIIELVLAEMTLHLENLLIALLVQRFPLREDMHAYQQVLADKAEVKGVPRGLSAIEYFIDTLVEEK